MKGIDLFTNGPLLLILAIVILLVKGHAFYNHNMKNMFDHKLMFGLIMSLFEQMDWLYGFSSNVGYVTELTILQERLWPVLKEVLLNFHFGFNWLFLLPVYMKKNSLVSTRSSSEK